MEQNKITTKEQAEFSFKEFEEKELKRINLKIGELNKIVGEIRDFLLDEKLGITELSKLKEQVQQYIFEFTELEFAPEYQPRIHFSNEKTKKQYIEKWNKRMRETVVRLQSYLPVIESKIENKSGTENLIRMPDNYTQFWMQLTKEYKQGEPCLSKDKVELFLRRAFSEEKINNTFEPVTKKIELQHGAWLFYDNYLKPKKVRKDVIVGIMCDCFPSLFDRNKFKLESKNIKDCGNNSARIFQIV